MSRPGQSSSRDRPRKGYGAPAAPDPGKRSARRRGSSSVRERPASLFKPAEGEPITPGRKWAAVGVGTILGLGAFWLLVAAVLAQDEDSGLETNTGILLSLGLLMIPLVMAGIAWVSQRPNWIRASLFAGAIGFAVTVWLPFLTSEPVTPVVVGLGAGAVIALRIEDDHSLALRAAVVGMVGVYTWVMVQVSVGAAMLLGPLLPIAAVGAADAYRVRRAEREAINR